MAIEEVSPTHTPNSGRVVWNTNDKELEARLNALALNVRAAPYNAKGDGIADDRPAIQAALNDCHAAGGGYVFIPSGTYLLATDSLKLQDGVNLCGAGMYTTILKLGRHVNKPVITDASAGIRGAYAFGRVSLASLCIDGSKEYNSRGQEGIFTTAYYSTFTNLYIRHCSTHGIRMGFEGMANAASQNQIMGCRIARCGGSGIYMDINGIDHNVCNNYIHECEHGVVIKNGGVRIVNNDIFGHRSSAVLVQQTSYGCIIATNNFNANRRQGIYVTRTTITGSGPWGQMLVYGNSLCGDALGRDNAYDAIYAETSVPNGIAKVTIGQNKVFTIGGRHRYRFGINLENNVTRTKCVGNHMNDVASGSYHVGLSCSHIELDSMGGGVLGPPAVPPSGRPLTNPYHVPVTIHLAGGAVTAVAVAGHSTGLTGGTFRLPAGQAITLTYTAAPRWLWLGD